MTKIGLYSVTLFCVASALMGPRAHATNVNVRDYGAKGDGTTLDTASLNSAIAAGASGGGGRVLIPAGKYLTGTVKLKSNVTLFLEAGAELVGTHDLKQYEHFTPPKGIPLVGSHVRWHRALILGDGVENVTIAGQGIINGNDATDPEGEERIRGPHTLLVGNSKNITIRDVSIRNAGNYAALFEFTNHIEVRGIKVTGGYDGVHLRGWKNKPCSDVSITDCEFYTGDDCIAGWYWKDVLIDRCVLNSSSNGIRVFGPAKNVIVHSCLAFGPGRYQWRTSGLLNHKNMAAGICLQPSAWGETEGVVDDVHISDVAMHDVGTPFHIAAQPPSTVGHMTIDRLSATGVYRAAASIEGWSGEPVARVDIRDSTIQFVGGFGPVWSDPAEAAVAYATAQSTEVKPPGNNPRPLPAWGLYARHVESLNLSDVKVEIKKQDDRPAFIFDGVEALELDSLKWPIATPHLMAFKNVLNIVARDVPIATQECRAVQAATEGKKVIATVQSGKSGLAKVELKSGDKTIARWAWLIAGEKVDVVFTDLPKPERGRSYDVVCGSVRAEVNLPPRAAVGAPVP